MTPITMSVVTTLAAALTSAVLVLGFELVALDPGYRAAQPLLPLAAAGAMAIFALVSRAISTMIAAAARGSVPGAAELVGIRPSTVKRHLADLKARSGLTTQQLIYRGTAEGGWSCRA